MEFSASKTNIDASFPEKERLKGKAEISELFEKGSFFYLKPFKIYFLEGSQNEFPRVLISVPKSRFSRASERNLLKRRIRESYRLSKASIIDRLSSNGINLKKIGFVYVEDRLFSFAYLMKTMADFSGSVKRSIKKRNA